MGEALLRDGLGSLGCTYAAAFWILSLTLDWDIKVTNKCMKPWCNHHAGKRPISITETISEGLGKKCELAIQKITMGPVLDENWLFLSQQPSITSRSSTKCNIFVSFILIYIVKLTGLALCKPYIHCLGTASLIRLSSLWKRRARSWEKDVRRR